MKEINYENEIKNILKQLNIPFHLQGYYYLIDVIVTMMKNNWDNRDLTSKVYPCVAEKNETTPKTIERSIRYAIKWPENIVSRVSKKNLFLEEENEINGLTYNFYGKKTNGKIIMSIIQSLKAMEKDI